VGYKDDREGRGSGYDCARCPLDGSQALAALTPGTAASSCREANESHGDLGQKQVGTIICGSRVDAILFDQGVVSRQRNFRDPKTFARDRCLFTSRRTRCPCALDTRERPPGNTAVELMRRFYT
jgi:hypothetical protein